MEEKNIKIKSGLVKVNVGDVGYFSFNPADVSIVERYENVIKVVEALDEKAGAIEISDTIKEQFDYLLASNASETLFKNVSPLALTEDGDFFFEVVMLAIVDLVDETMNKRLKAKEKKINKALAKYKA